MLLMPVCGNEDIWSRAEVFWWPCRTTFGWTTSWGKDCKAALASTSNCRKVAERATDEVLMHKILIPMDNLSISTGFPWISGFWFSNDRALPSTSPTAPGMFASQKACAVFVHGSDFGEDFLGGFSQAGTTIQLGVGRIARFGFGIPGKRRGDFPTLILMDDVLPRCFLSIFRWEFGFLIWTEKGGKKPKKAATSWILRSDLTTHCAGWMSLWEDYLKQWQHTTLWMTRGIRGAWSWRNWSGVDGGCDWIFMASIFWIYGRHCRI